ncbi:unnamed protein product [Protopolystoma xenopodis]|uniref:NADH:ubiquinone reductase (H(+)-translocating) n=1 Tax=Protopolystoma xenopodis TaxID=117903 RepID=A0A3S5CSJ5_9PLAT|nr:unnamed protein product [Protopolystoma xenopodis]
MWKYLGVVRYLLILYYSKSDRLRVGLITMLVSRIGDVGFFVLVGYSFISKNFTVVVLTKRVSFPFVSWLLEVIRAPTPVSALVHSSTLVAAGMWFVCCYSWLFSSVETASDIIVISCFITIFITEVGGTFNKKKNSIVFVFFLGKPTLSLVQLLCHGVAKCGLFIRVGDIMSSGGGSQNYTNFYSRKSLWELCSLFFIIFKLCGLPFLGVFFSKHLFFSALSWYNIMFWVACLFGLILRFCYSVRLFLLCVVGKSGYNLSFDKKFVFVVLQIPMFRVINMFLGDLVVDWCESDLWISVCLLLCSIVGVFLGVIISYTYFRLSRAWVISLMGMDLCKIKFLFYLSGDESIYVLFGVDMPTRGKLKLFWCSGSVAGVAMVIQLVSGVVCSIEYVKFVGSMLGFSRSVGEPGPIIDGLSLELLRFLHL